MTTEIAIMNKSAIALAADSAVTIGHVSPQGQEQKIYNSANKLFALSKYAPVGIMIYGSASLMGIPWETIIKTFRNRLGKRKYRSLKDYYEQFFNYLDNFNVGTETEQKYVSEISLSIFSGIRNELDGFVKNKIKPTDPLTEKEVLNKLQSIVQQWFNNIHGASKDCVFSKTKKLTLKKKYSQIIKDALLEVFQKFPIPDSEVKKLIQMALIAISIGPPTLQSGVVIAGFGEDEIYPACYDYNVKAVLEGKAIRSITKQESITHDSHVAIIPFAQDDDVRTFMEGMGGVIDKFFSKAFKSMMTQDFPLKMTAVLSDKLNITGEKDAILKIVKEMGRGVYDEIIQKLRSLKNEHYIGPVVQATGYLNKGELATMTETLVNLVSFRKQVTLETETVGGPIDVAVISKGDGFVWIKRKHYFNPALNHHFFKNYFPGGFANEKE